MPAPTFSSSDPIHGATNVYLNKKVTATFSESLDTASVSGSTVILRSVALDTVIDAEISVSGAIITIIPYTVLLGNSIYRLTFIGADLSLPTGAIQSGGNNFATTQTISFQTGEQLDTTSVAKTAEEIVLAGDLNLPSDIAIASSGMKIVSSLPTNHKFGVSTTENTIQIKFSNTIDAATVTTETVQLEQYAFLDEKQLLAKDKVFYINATDADYSDLSVTRSVLDKTITITRESTRDWMNNSTIEVYLASTIADTSGDTLGTAQKITLHIEPYPNLVGIRMIRNELGTLIPNTYLDDYLGLRIWLNTIEEYETLGSKIDIGPFSKNRAFREYIKYKTCLDIIQDMRGEKDTNAGVSKQLNDLRISFFPAGADSVGQKEKMLHRRMDTARESIIGYMNSPRITVIDRGSAIIRGSRQIRGPFLFNPLRNVYVSDPIPAANTSRERDRLIAGLSDQE
jgi:hypothetical protein